MKSFQVLCIFPLSRVSDAEVKRLIFEMFKEIFFPLILVANVIAEFELQSIGQTLTHEEVANQKFCISKYCVSDAELLFYAATQNANVDPCLDFKEFAMGTFIELRATNDRYREIGLISDTKHNHDERKRKLIAQEIDEKDSRVVKVVKNFFAKCVNSRKYLEAKWWCATADL